MKELCIQFQPARAPFLSAAGFIELIREFAKREGFPVSIYEGDDDGSYINFCFAAEDWEPIWKSLAEYLQLSSSPNSEVANALIATGEIDAAREKYWLLHHFDGVENG